MSTTAEPKEEQKSQREGSLLRYCHRRGTSQWGGRATSPSHRCNIVDNSVNCQRDSTLRHHPYTDTRTMSYFNWRKFSLWKSGISWYHYLRPIHDESEDPRYFFGDPRVYGPDATIRLQRAQAHRGWWSGQLCCQAVYFSISQCPYFLQFPTRPPDPKALPPASCGFHT